MADHSVASEQNDTISVNCPHIVAVFSGTMKHAIDAYLKICDKYLYEQYQPHRYSQLEP